MKHALVLIACLACPAWASALAPDAVQKVKSAQVVIVGEIHDNPDHHALQAELAAQMTPSAIVFEMLTDDQAARVTPAVRSSASTLNEVLEWDQSGWPDFAMYYPIFAAAPEARIFGAQVPRDKARATMENGIESAFGPEAARFGLTEDLPQDEQAAREAHQFAAHCDALPEDLLPNMVAIQRLRDAELAQAAVIALEQTGGPVLVITGNGHAREDWGMPVYLERVRPDARVVTIGQSEDGVAPPGIFDLVLDAPSVERGDPCEAFR